MLSNKPKQFTGSKGKVTPSITEVHSTAGMNVGYSICRCRWRKGSRPSSHSSAPWFSPLCWYSLTNYWCHQNTPLSSRWALITFWSSGSSLLIKLFPMWLGLWVVLWSQKLDPKANSEYLEFFTCFLWILFRSCLSIYLCISPVSILLANDSSPVLYYAFFPSLLP